MTEPPSGLVNGAARLLGAGGEIPGELRAQITDAYERLKSVETPRATWGFFDITINGASVIFGGAFRIEGQDLAGLLRGCSRAVLMAVTLGPQVDRLINQLQATSMSEAALLDACASVEADLFCDSVENEVSRLLGSQEFLTMRYSPGYGDVPLAESAKILAALDTRKKIGLSATASGMLVPIKSITAMIGITDEKRDRERDCSQCGASVGCPYKKRGDSCGI